MFTIDVAATSAIRMLSISAWGQEGLIMEGFCRVGGKGLVMMGH